MSGRIICTARTTTPWPRDTAVDIPRSIQWVAEPRWGRSHEELASLSAAVTAQGRIFYIVDEAPLASIRFPGDWKLVARDAFNGTLLWKRPITSWVDHLRHFRSGPVHLPRRLVAVGDRVYVTPSLDGPVLALDAATGQTVCEYKGTEQHGRDHRGQRDSLPGRGNLRGGPDRRRVVHTRRAGAVGFRFITAIDAAIGEAVVEKRFHAGRIPPAADAGGEGFATVLPEFVRRRLSRCAGPARKLWKTARPTPARRMGFSAPTLVATDEVVLLADLEPPTGENKPLHRLGRVGRRRLERAGIPAQGKSTLRAYAAKDGQGAVVGAMSRRVQLAGRSVRHQRRRLGRPGLPGLDLKTGAPAKAARTPSPRGSAWPHHRCYRNKASERFIFTGKSGIEVLSLDQGCWLSNNSWIRGTCQYGILPANGLLYAPPNACACFLTSKVAGFFAAAPQRDKTGHMPFPDAARARTRSGLRELTTPTPRLANDDWPAYRHDSRRSGADARRDS